MGKPVGVMNFLGYIKLKGINYTRNFIIILSSKKRIRAELIKLLGKQKYFIQLAMKWKEPNHEVNTEECWYMDW